MNGTHEPSAAETPKVFASETAAATTAGDTSHDEHGAHNVAKHVRGYLVVGATLLTFTAITVFLSYVNFGTQKANIAVAMLVATFKACLVAAVFMHLSSEKRMIYRILIFTFFFVFGLFWLTYLTWYDPITR